MKAYIISDKEYQTSTYDLIYEKTMGFLTEKGFEIVQTQIKKGDLAYCMGCFGCWVKNPGQCSIQDLMSHINYNYMNSDLVVYLCPIVFGQFSANMKNAVDRWIPNILPFFKIRKDGSTIHTSRYCTYPQQIMIGYADSLANEDAQLFTDISMKHRRAVKVIIHNNSLADLITTLNKIEFKRAGAVI